MPGKTTYQRMDHEKQIADRQSEPVALWDAYLRERTHDRRNDLLMHYVDLVKRVVNRLFANRSSYHDYDDLISCGVIGLMDAIERFEPRSGARFESYAQIRIRGEIIDYMRSQDWLPVNLRTRLRQVQAAYEELSQELGREPEDREAAERLDIGMEELRQILGQAHFANIIRFDDLMGENTGPEQFQSTDTRIEIIHEANETRDLLVREMKNLSEREQLILSLYYNDELTLKEIGLVLGLTESRISQIHSKTLLRLKSRMQQLQ